MKFHITNSHEVIRTWVEGHNGKPAVVRGSVDPLNSLSILWHDKNVPDDMDLEEISWDEFFDAFETGNLSFRYSQDDNAGPHGFEFNFIDRDSIPALNNEEFMLPEENEMAQENMFPSAPKADERGITSE